MVVSKVVRGGDDNLVVVVDRIKGIWELRELPRTFYPNANRRLYERVLTDKHSSNIHKTAYSILIIITIYQDKKIG